MVVLRFSGLFPFYTIPNSQLCEKARTSAVTFLQNFVTFLMKFCMLLQHEGVLKLISILFHTVNLQMREHYCGDFILKRPLALKFAIRC